MSNSKSSTKNSLRRYDWLFSKFRGPSFFDFPASNQSSPVGLFQIVVFITSIRSYRQIVPYIFKVCFEYYWIRVWDKESVVSSSAAVDYDGSVVYDSSCTPPWTCIDSKQIAKSEKRDDDFARTVRTNNGSKKSFSEPACLKYWKGMFIEMVQNLIKSI